MHVNGAFVSRMTQGLVAIGWGMPRVRAGIAVRSEALLGLAAEPRRRDRAAP
jgi:hypothetical protein